MEVLIIIIALGLGSLFLLVLVISQGLNLDPNAKPATKDPASNTIGAATSPSPPDQGSQADPKGV